MVQDNTKAERQWAPGELGETLAGADGQKRTVRQLVLDGAAQILRDEQVLGGNEVEIYRAHAQIKEWLRQHRGPAVGDAEASVVDELAGLIVRLLKREVFDQVVVCRMAKACALVAECAVAERRTVL